MPVVETFVCRNPEATPAMSITTPLNEASRVDVFDSPKPLTIPGLKISNFKRNRGKTDETLL
jgi:hypothetical protein